VWGLSPKAWGEDPFSEIARDPVNESYERFSDLKIAPEKHRSKTGGGPRPGKTNHKEAGIGTKGPEMGPSLRNANERTANNRICKGVTKTAPLGEKQGKMNEHLTAVQTKESQKESGSNGGKRRGGKRRARSAGGKRRARLGLYSKRQQWKKRERICKKTGNEGGEHEKKSFGRKGGISSVLALVTPSGKDSGRRGGKSESVSEPQ